MKRWLNTPEGKAWGYRRSEAFGIASAKYFKRKAQLEKKGKK